MSDPRSARPSPSDARGRVFPPFVRFVGPVAIWSETMLVAPVAGIDVVVVLEPPLPGARHRTIAVERLHDRTPLRSGRSFADDEQSFTDPAFAAEGIVMALAGLFSSDRGVSDRLPPRSRVERAIANTVLPVALQEPVATQRLFSWLWDVAIERDLGPAAEPLLDTARDEIGLTPNEEEIALAAIRAARLLRRAGQRDVLTRFAITTFRHGPERS